jgi:hypothetical protein
MIQVSGVTYRIERRAPHCYTVIRVLDDAQVGTFRTAPSLRIQTSGLELSVFRDVVRAALRSARTSAVMQAARFCPPEELPAPENPIERTPSSMPPRPALA